LGSSEEEGMDWDELEKEAEREDRGKSHYDENEDRGGNKKRKGDSYGNSSKKQRRR